MLALSMAVMVVSVLVGFYLFVIAESTRLVAKIYSCVLLLGATVSFLSIIFFFLVPQDTWICQLRQWMAALGFTLFLGALFTKSLQIHRITRMKMVHTLLSISKCIYRYVTHTSLSASRNATKRLGIGNCFGCDLYRTAGKCSNKLISVVVAVVNVVFCLIVYTMMHRSF